MDSRFEQRAVIKFLIAESVPSTEIYDRLLQVFRDNCLGRTQVFEWAKRFREGRCDVLDDPRPGRPLTATDPATVIRVEELVREDRRMTIEQIADVVDVSTGAVHQILHESLNMRKVCARWVPKMLTPEQKQARVDTCEELLELFHEDPNFLDRLVTQDESWFHLREPESKQDSMVWKRPGSPRPSKFKVTTSKEKVLYSFFWDQQGVIVQWPVEKGRTVTGQYHANLLRNQLHPQLKIKRRGKISRGVLLQQDNAPPHQSLVAQAAVRELGYELVPHPPYSPDLAPSDFFLFGKLKSEPRGRSFESRAALGSAIFQSLQRWSDDVWNDGLKKLPERWHKCIRSRGDYFESVDIWFCNCIVK